MPLGLAILSFFGIEFLALIAIRSLEVGFVPAIIGAIAVYFFAAKREATQNERTDNPPIEQFKLPAPNAYAIIKRVLRNFRYGERAWQITDDLRDTYEITYISKWKDRS